jgi:hypothetical protein
MYSPVGLCAQAWSKNTLPLGAACTIRETQMFIKDEIVKNAQAVKTSPLIYKGQ